MFTLFCAQAQNGSNLLSGKKSQKISFELINNLIILPLNLNGVEGNFILDTGVKGNILFLGEKNHFTFSDSLKTKKLKGFGFGKPVEAYISIGNTISFKYFKLSNKDFYLLKDANINFSAKTGVAIHGLIGSDFFQDNVIKIDYKKSKLTIYDSEYYYKKKHNKKRFEKVDLVFHNNKPYMEGKVKIFENDTMNIPIKLLIDTGGSDALWLFKDDKVFDKLPQKAFRDLLGESLTGSIHGDKSRIEQFAFGSFDFVNPVVSFLNEDVSNGGRKIKGRNGSLGGGILNRFTIWFDYKNDKMFVKKNSNYDKGFFYNMSGLEINHNGYVQVLESRESGPVDQSTGRRILLDFYYASKPTYVIANVRKGSPGHVEGLMKGDVILEINSLEAHDKSYDELIDLFYRSKNKRIDLLVDRNGEELFFKVKLIDELD